MLNIQKFYIKNLNSKRTVRLYLNKIGNIQPNNGKVLFGGNTSTIIRKYDEIFIDTPRCVKQGNNKGYHSIIIFDFFM